MSTRIAEAAIVFSAVTGPLKKQTQDAVRYIGDVDKAAGRIGKNGGVDNLRQQIVDQNKALKHSHSLATNLRTQQAALDKKHADAREGSGFLGNVTKGIVGGLTFGLGVAGIEGASALGGMVAEAVDLAGQFERTQLSFETMLGSADKAQTMLGNIKTFAAESPLSLSQAADAGKQLLAYGIAADQVVPTLRALTDVASGTGVELGRLTLAYGQVATSGRLYGTELRQFTEAGVPVIDALAVALNKPKESIKSLVEDGKVGFNDLIKSFKILTEDGGKFAGMTEKYAGSLNGQIDRLKDSVETLKREVGTAIIEETGLKAATADMTAFTDRVKEGVNSLRPAIRMGGDLLKAGVQIGNEIGKFVIILGEARIEGLTRSLPVLKDVQNFRIDPVVAGDFAVTLMAGSLDAITLLEKGLVEIGLNTKEGLIDPLVDAAKSLKTLADSIHKVMKDIGIIEGATVVKINGDAERLAIQLARQSPPPKPGGIWDLGQPIQPPKTGFELFGMKPDVPEVKPKPTVMNELREWVRLKMLEVKTRLGERDFAGLTGGYKQEPFMGVMGPAMAGLAFNAKETARLNTTLKEVANVIPARLIEGAEKLNKEFLPRFDPLAKFGKDFADLRFMENRNIITKDVKALASTDLFRELAAGLGGLAEMRLPQLMEAGSREASRLEMSAIGAGNSGSVLSVLRAIQTAVEEELRQSRITDEDIKKALAELGVKVELPSR
jgi:tape measure domain-containing protein